jgi:Fe2+ or Zn2+ uptake regulation protein
MQNRQTKQREKILRVLRETGSHPTANTIYKAVREEIPKVSLGTVYRNLKVLIEQGYVQKIPIDGMVDRFEAKIAPHYHLICEKCGVVQDFEMPDRLDIDKYAQTFSDFSISRHRIDFYGKCKQCRNNAIP